MGPQIIFGKAVVVLVSEEGPNEVLLLLHLRGLVLGDDTL